MVFLLSLQLRRKLGYHLTYQVKEIYIEEQESQISKKGAIWVLYIGQEMFRIL